MLQIFVKPFSSTMLTFFFIAMKFDPVNWIYAMDFGKTKIVISGIWLWNGCKCQCFIKSPFVIWYAMKCAFKMKLVVCSKRHVCFKCNLNFEETRRQATLKIGIFWLYATETARVHGFKSIDYLYTKVGKLIIVMLDAQYKAVQCIIPYSLPMYN